MSSSSRATFLSDQLEASTVMRARASVARVLTRDLFAAYPDAPGHAGPQHRSVRPANLDLHCRKDLSGGAEPVLHPGIGGLDRGAVVIGAQDCDGGTGLRQAVGVDEIDM